MSRLLLRAASGLALLCLLIAPLVVFAHKDIDVGNYTIEYGWVTEPTTVGQANALVINIGPKLGETTVALSIASPADDSAVQGDKVEVTIAVEGLTAADANLHWHLKVDGQTLSMSPISKTTVTVSGLSNGDHTIEAILAGEDHGELGEPTHTKITVEGSTATGSALVLDAGEMHAGGSDEELKVDVSALKVEMVYANETTTLTLKPVEGGAPGQYTADFTPARAGLYTLKLSGKLNGTLGESEVNLEVNPEEVTPGQTPPTAGDSGEANTPWIILGGLAVIILGLAVGVFFVTRKK